MATVIAKSAIRHGTTARLSRGRVRQFLVIRSSGQLLTFLLCYKPFVMYIHIQVITELDPNWRLIPGTAYYPDASASGASDTSGS
jgi:hypothetical protein